MKCIAFIVCYLYLPIVFSAELNIEHQIRLCDSKDNILKAFDKFSLNKKKMDVFYLETSDLFLSKNFLSIRLRVKDQKLEVTVKKRMKSKIIDLGNEVCEYDLHGDVSELSCKVDRDLDLNDFEKLKNNKITWKELLNKAQLNLLGNIEIPDKLLIFGTLVDERFSFADMTLDIVHVKNHDEVTYHEISKRYLKSNDGSEGIKFEDFVKNTGIKQCPNQIEWDVSKFNILENI